MPELDFCCEGIWDDCDWGDPTGSVFLMKGHWRISLFSNLLKIADLSELHDFCKVHVVVVGSRDFDLSFVIHPTDYSNLLY